MRILGVVLLFSAMPLAALNNRSAVSVSGSDSNPCTVASPCRSFAVALPVTASGGEIITLDSAGYGPFTINQSVIVSGAPGAHAAITVTSGDGIHISGGNVTLRNLVFIGSGTAQDAISVTTASELHVHNCYIRGFNNDGIQVSGVGTLAFIDNVFIDDCNVAIEFDDAFGFVDDAILNGCTDGIVGISSVGGSFMGLSIVNTKIAHATHAIDLTGFGTNQNLSAKLDRNSLTFNNVGLFLATGSGGTVFVRLTNNDIDSINVSGATAYTITSYGNNSIGSTGGATIAGLTLQ